MSKGSRERFIPFTAAVQAGDWLLFQGEVGLRNNVLVEGGVLVEFEEIMRSIRRCLASAPCARGELGLESIVHVTAYLLDRKDIKGVRAAYAKLFGNQRSLRIIIAYSLSFPDAHIEVDAAAYTYVAPEYEIYDSNDSR